jgi:VWFA-related protein
MFRGASGVIVLCTAVLVGQEQPPQPRFRAGVTFVQVDVSVLDHDRLPVRGLTTEDFGLREDGQPQKIITFKEIAVPSPEAPSTPWMREVAPDVRVNDAAERRLFVLVLDDAQVRMEPRTTARVKEIGRRIINELGPNDLAAVVFTRNNSGAQDFTNDRGRLLRAVNAFAPALTASGSLRLPQMPRSGQVSGDQEGMYFNRASVGVLKNVAKYLTVVLERRKALIYVSEGVPVNFVAGGEMAIVAQETQDALREAQRANVNIYCIDPQGLALDEEMFSAGFGPPPPPAERLYSSFNLKREFLRSVAAETGGLAILDRNEFGPGVAQIFRENGSYYLIGYESSNVKTDGKFRRIDVRINRPGLTVRARRGYYGARSSRPEKEGTAASGLNATLLGLLPRSDVAMQAFAAPFALTGRREAAVAIVVGIRQFTRPEGARQEETVEVLAAAYGPEGQFKSSTREKIQYVPQPGHDRLEHEILSRLELKPGRYSVRVAARSAVLGKSGSVFYDVDVPDFAREPLSLSGLVLSATPAPPAAPRERLASLLPVVPTTRREFSRSDQVIAFLRAYQGGRTSPGPVTLTVRVTDRLGATVLDMPQPIASGHFAANRGANFRFDLPLQQLAPGPWLLTVEATGSKQATARRDVRFVVR